MKGLPENQRHFQIVDAQIEGLTPEGRVTVKILKLNEPERVTERRLLALAKLYPRELS
jgi:hypothetical protein